MQFNRNERKAVYFLIGVILCAAGALVAGLPETDQLIDTVVAYVY